MAETDNSNPAGGVNDPLKMRNTETAALKRMPVSPNSASASSAARKTIKLKPLTPSASAPGASSPASPVAVPPFMLNKKPAAPSAPKPDEPPKFMSTNTAPINKMAVPQAKPPIQAGNLGNPPQPSSAAPTVQLPRAPVINAAKPAAPAPAPAAPVNTETVTVPKMAHPAPGSPIKPVSLGVKPAAPAPAAPAAPAAPLNTETVTVPKMAQPAPASPIKPVSIGVKPAAPAPAAPAVKPPVSTNTQGVQKQAIAQAKMQSGLQGAKPAIKLRPSASPTQNVEANPMSPTIKLNSPAGDSAVSPVPSSATAPAAAAPAPADATAPAAAPAEAAAPAPAPAPGAPQKPADVTVTTKIPRAKPTLKKPVMPGSAPGSGASLREQGDIANQKMKTAVSEGQQVITQTGDAVKPPSPVMKNGKKKKGAAAAAEEAAKNEPNFFFAFSAILAFIVVGYIVFALTAQFLNTWEQKKIPVVGFEQIDQNMGKK